MASSIMANFEVEKLIRKMNNLDRVVTKLFEINSRPILKEKISQYEEMIADLPDDYDQVANEFRDKVVNLWERYCTLKGVEEPSLYITNSMWQSRVSPLTLMNDNHVNGQNGETSSSNGKTSPSTISAISTNSYDSANFPNKETFRANVASEFAALPAITDLNGLKRLAVLVAKSFKQSINFHDNHLKSELFSMAFSKLSEPKQAEFCAKYGDGNRILKDIGRFLKEDIINQLREKRQQQQQSEVCTNNEDQTDQENRCGYCKKQGHLTISCPEITNQVCDLR